MSYKHIKSFAGITAFSIAGKIIGAIYKIIIVSIIGLIGMGYYQLSYPMFVFGFSLASGGIGTILTLSVAENYDNYFKQKAILKYFNKITLLISALCAIFIIVFSNFFAKIQMHNNLYYIYFFIAFAIVFASLNQNYKNYARGCSFAKVYAISDFIENLIKYLMAVLLAFLFINNGASVAVCLIYLCIIISVIVSTAIIMFAVNKNKTTKFNSVSLSNMYKKELLVGAIECTATSFIPSIINIIESFLVVNLLIFYGSHSSVAVSLFGLSRGTISAIIGVPVLFVGALQFVMLPFVARQGLKCIKQIKFLLFIILFVLCVMASVCYLFSEQILSILYINVFTAEELKIGVNLLKIGAFELLFCGLSAYLSIVLQGLKKLKSCMIAIVISGVLKLVFLVFLTKYISIYALGFSGVLYYLVCCIINLIVLVVNKVDITSFKHIIYMFCGLIFGVGAKFYYNVVFGGVLTLLNLIISLIVVSCVFGIVVGGYFYLKKDNKLV